jgi:hypothetical protein
LEQRGERFRRGVLPFARCIQVRSLDTKVPGKLQNGFLD